MIDYLAGTRNSKTALITFGSTVAQSLYLRMSVLLEFLIVKSTLKSLTGFLKE